MCGNRWFKAFDSSRIRGYPSGVIMLAEGAKRASPYEKDPLMDWRVVSVTFGLVFLAELGDKTQLMVFGRSAQTGSPLAVFIGASAALVASTLIGVLVGGMVGKLPEWVVKGTAGVLFIVLGAWTLYGLKK
jgi:Ca2+/H+ antiporter, TMEM165/GDT1 family